MVQQSKSWLELKPLKIIDDLKEDFDDYFQCVQQNEELQHIPKEILVNISGSSVQRIPVHTVQRNPGYSVQFC